MTLPDDCPVEEEEVGFRPEKHTLTFEFDEEEREAVMEGARLESVGPEEPDHVFGESPVESFSGSMEVELDPAVDPLAHRLLTSTPRGAGKSMVNHLYGAPELKKLYPDIMGDDDEPDGADAMRMAMWQGAQTRAEALRRRREREDRDLPGVEPSMIVCAHCGECEYELSEGTIEREDDWFCSINCLNAEVGP